MYTLALHSLAILVQMLFVLVVAAWLSLIAQQIRETHHNVSLHKQLSNVRIFIYMTRCHINTLLRPIACSSFDYKLLLVDHRAMLYNDCDSKRAHAVHNAICTCRLSQLLLPIATASCFSVAALMS
jgi:CYTH domain-containing protein